MRGWRLLVLIVLLWCCLPGRALADDATDEDRKERALALIKEGRSRYDLGKLDEAIRLFEQAYEVHAYAEALYNLAQAWRQKGEPKKAVFYYKSYLRNKPDAANRELVEQRILELERLAVEQDSSRSKPPEGTQEPAHEAPATPATVPVNVRNSGTKARPWYVDSAAWIVAGLGVGALTAGGGYLVAAEVERAKLDSASEFERIDIRSEIAARQRIGAIGLIAGGVTAVVGVVLLIHNPASSPSSLRMNGDTQSFSLVYTTAF